MFEGDRQHLFRMLRSTKNRYGPTSELGLFRMQDQGLVPVGDPSRVLLTERPVGAPGSVVAGIVEGSRPMLVEVQALVARSAGLPRRVVTGLDGHRVALVAAVLERHGHLRLQDQDVFVKVTGGVEVEDPAADLAVAVAIASSYTGQPVPEDWVLIGEVGLTGEIRSASRMSDRLREAQQLGLKRALAPGADDYDGPLAVQATRAVRQALSILGVGARHPEGS